MKIIHYIKRFVKLLLDRNYRFDNMSDIGFFKWMNDEEFLKKKYYAKLGKQLELNDPQTFNEKLQWLKLYDHNPLYTKMVDKLEVKEYVASVIGEEYIIPTLGFWESGGEIDWDNLPQQFVLKVTHDSGGIVICKNKTELNKNKAAKFLNRSLKKDYYMVHREWPYKNVKRRIIAEQFLYDSKSKDLVDYKFMCFNGKCKCVFTGSDRFSDSGLKVTFYDLNWNILPFERHYPARKEPEQKPENFNKMIELSEKLAVGIPFVRIDFYEVNNKVYFGEMTFFPGSGFEEFTPSEWDYRLGSWLELPKEKTV